MRVGENEFIVSTMDEEVYFHSGKKKKTNSRKLKKGVYKMNIVDKTIVDKLITFNMTSEKVIIKEFETMKTFLEEHIERLEKKYSNIINLDSRLLCMHSFAVRKRKM